MKNDFMQIIKLKKKKLMFFKKCSALVIGISYTSTNTTVIMYSLSKKEGKKHVNSNEIG
jgi:hypothetical protein